MVPCAEPGNLSNKDIKLINKNGTPEYFIPSKKTLSDMELRWMKFWLNK